MQNVSVLPEESDAAAEKKLLATKTERGVLVTIRDWKTDTYVNTKLIFDVVLRVFDSTGKERAKPESGGKIIWAAVTLIRQHMRERPCPQHSERS